MRSPVVALNIFISAVLVAAAPRDAAPLRVDALPLAKIFALSFEGPPPVAAAADSERMLAGWADHLDVFSLGTGAREWSLPVPATRAACDTMFCVVADDTTVRGIDLGQPAVGWQQRLDAPLAAAPTIKSGWVLLATATGSVRALQAVDGREVWRFNAESAITGPPSINGNQVAIATVSGVVTLLDLSTGRVGWTMALDSIPGAPRLGGGRVFVGTENGRLVTLDDRDGRLLFEYRMGANVTGAPTLDERHIYTVGFDGVLRAFDRGNGSQRWYSNLATRAAAGPHVDGDLVFVPLRTGAVDVRLNDKRIAASVPAPSAETTMRLAMPPLFVGEGRSLSILTLSSDLNDSGKWTLTRYGGGVRLAPVAWPSLIPGHPLTVTATARITPDQRSAGTARDRQ